MTDRQTDERTQPQSLLKMIWFQLSCVNQSIGAAVHNLNSFLVAFPRKREHRTKMQVQIIGIQRLRRQNPGIIRFFLRRRGRLAGFDDEGGRLHAPLPRTSEYLQIRRILLYEFIYFLGAGTVRWR